MVGKRLKGKGRVSKGEGVSIVKGVEGVLPISLPGIKKLLHNINTHRYSVIILNNECILFSRKTF
jgi:hypothetical protein